MSLFDRLRELFDRDRVSLELDDIQATVLRARPEPYYGTHVVLRIDDASGGRELLRRLVLHVASAADWATSGEAWISVALSHPGLVALGVPEEVLNSFPESFRQGMAARADVLRDYGENAPEHWEQPYGTGDVHVALTVFSKDEEGRRRVLEMAQEQYEELSGVALLGTHDFGAQPDSRNSLGYKDNISQPAIEGSGVEPLPGQGPAIKAGEFVLGYPSESGELLAMPQPEVLGRNATFVVLRKYHSRVGAFNRFLHQHAGTEEERELLAAKMMGRWRSGAPLALAPERDDPELAQDPERNNDFTYADDQRGRRVPLGSHMRRMNPRDTELAQLTDVNIHRIVRQSTTYGPPYRPDATGQSEDEAERGIYFIFLSARAMETIEFLQREWINNGNFMDLSDERDPIVGLQPESANFTIPQEPARRRLPDIETFNVLQGGEYLFMPSLSGLRWLASQEG